MWENNGDTWGLKLRDSYTSSKMHITISGFQSPKEDKQTNKRDIATSLLSWTNKIHPLTVLGLIHTGTNICLWYTNKTKSPYIEGICCWWVMSACLVTVFHCGKTKGWSVLLWYGKIISLSWVFFLHRIIFKGTICLTLATWFLSPLWI